VVLTDTISPTVAGAVLDLSNIFRTKFPFSTHCKIALSTIT